jgi:hypothetical protein
MIGGRVPRFVPCERPLPPVAMALSRGRVPALLARWHRDPSGLERLQGLGARSSLLIFGEAEALPWVDGAVYLGRHPEAPRLLVPTALVPDVPYRLLERALFARRPDAGEPSAVLLDPLRLVDAASPGAFDVASLERWLAGDGR